MNEGEIRQQLGFDASQALDELTRLNTAFTGFGNQLTTTVNRLNYFNENAGKTVAALKQMASQADLTLASLAKLGSAPTTVTPAVGAGGLSSGAAAASQLDASLTQIVAAANAAAQAITNLGQVANTQLPRASNNTRSLTISWQTMARVVMTQAIVRALSTIRDAFAESYESALQFSKQVGEIRAIDPGRNFGAIAADIRHLSDAFNQPLSSVAEAQYQTISDQFVMAADRANILTAANQLAKVSAQELSDAAMLLTGALNAYGESSDMAGLRAAQFDKTIELGRLRMGELGTAMGRVQAIAHEVGLSMEELDASLIAITIGGVKANEAATQLRGVMTGLLKPSEGMKAAFREIGVDSGEAAIATWGFKGTLDQLQKTTNGSASAMAGLFQNVRGLAGALRLVGSGAEKYNEAIEKLGQVDQATLLKKFEEFTSTDAEKLTKELNKLKNFWTAEFGGDLLAAFAKLSGGADGLISVLRTLTGDLPGMGVAVTAFAGTLLTMGNNAKFTATNIGTLRGALTTLALMELGRVLGTQVGEAINKIIEAPQKALREATQQELDIRKQQTEAAIRESDRKNSELVKRLRQAVAEANKLYLQDADHFKAAVKVEEQVVKLSFDRIMQSRQHLTHELVSAAENAERQIADISRKSADIQTSIADREFTRWAQKVSGDLGVQFDIFRRKALELTDEATKLQGSAKDSIQEKLADQAWKRAEAFVKQSEQIASQTKDVEQLRKVQQLVDDLDEKRIIALAQQSKTQAEVAKEAERRANQAEAHNLELEGMRKAIEEKLKATTKDAGGAIQFKGKEQFQKDVGDADKLIAAFVAKFRQYGKEDFIQNFLGDPKAFEAMKRDAERALASADIKKIEVAPEAIAGMATTLQQSLDLLKLKCPVLAKIEKVTGLEILSEGLQKVIDAYEKKLNEATARAIRQPQVMASQMAVTDEYQAARNKFVGQIGGTLTPWELSKLGQEKATETLIERTKVRALAVEFDQLMRSTEITDQSLLKLKTDLQSINWEKAFFSPADRAKMATELETMTDALAKRKALLQQQKENAAPAGESQGELRRINQQIDAIQGKKAAQGEAASQTQRDIKTADAAINDQFTSISALIDRVNALAASWGAVANAAGAAASVMAGDGYSLQSQFAASGGRMQRLAAGGIARFFDDGGFASRGTDVIPAMLSPGEVVINAASARRFASQLVAMNAGVKPVFRSDGGSVTNIGDINVTVSGGGSSRQTARSIAAELRRELRRGTATL